MPVVYFDQSLGAGHSKHYSKYACILFFCAKKEEKARKLMQNLGKKGFFKFAPELGPQNGGRVLWDTNFITCIRY